MARTIKETLLAALDQHQGDDYERAMMAFEKMPADKWNEPYGQSGKTLNQIVAQYREHCAEIAAARSYVIKNL